MILYRVSTREHVRDLSGTGAFLYGGRWNEQGTHMLYTASSLSLAILEMIVHLSADKIKRGLYTAELDFPEELPVTVLPHLPDRWNAYPYTAGSMKLGTHYMRVEKTLCLRVPSAIVPMEFNYLLNPLHEDFQHIKIKDVRPLLLDQRLLPG